MATVSVGKENGTDIELYYEDHGVRSAGGADPRLPARRASWERQVVCCWRPGYRVIAYDRRGFGKSSQPSIGYDYDTFAADLNALLCTST